MYGFKDIDIVVGAVGNILRSKETRGVVLVAAGLMADAYNQMVSDGVPGEHAAMILSSIRK